MRKKSPKSASEASAPAGSKTLVIAEKPSVAADLAKVLKVPKATSDYFENDQWVISSSIGHVVRLNDPQDLDELDRVRRGGHIGAITAQQMRRHPIPDPRIIQVLRRADQDAALGCDRLDAIHQIGIVGHVSLPSAMLGY